MAFLSFINPSPWAMGAIAFGVGGLSSGGLLAYSVFAPRCQFWSPVIRSIPQRDGVSLTFDDGPDERYTPQILDCLAEQGVKATFFVIGRFAKKHPDLIRRIHAAGHLLGNHSLDHDHFGVKKGRQYWREQLSETQKIVGDIVGMPPYLFRPPMGFKTWHIAAAAREMHLPVIGWSLPAGDAKPVHVDQLARRLIRRSSGHDIVVMHDGVDPGRKVIPGKPPLSQQATVDALPIFLNSLAERKLRVLNLLEALLPVDDAAPARRPV